MGVTISEISAIVARYGNEVVTEQQSMRAPILDILDTFTSAATGNVNVRSGGLDSTQMISDGGALPTGAVSDFIPLNYSSINAISRLAIPRQSAMTATGEKDSVNLVLEQLKVVGSDQARQVGRAVFGSALETITGTQATEVGTGVSGLTLTVASASEYKQGTVFERRDGYGNLEEFCRVTKIVYADSGFGGTLTLARDITSLGVGSTTDNWAASDVLYLRGGYTNQIESLESICGSGSVYGKSTAEDDWSGNLLAAGGALTLVHLRKISTLINRRSGQRADCIVGSPSAIAKVGDLQVGVRRFSPGDKLDVYGKQLEKAQADFEGIPAMLDPNCSDDSLFFISKDDVKLHQTIPLGYEKASGGHVSLKNAATSSAAAESMLVSQSAFSYDCQFWQSVNLRITRRNSTGQINGITS